MRKKKEKRKKKKQDKRVNMGVHADLVFCQDITRPKAICVCEKKAVYVVRK